MSLATFALAVGCWDYAAKVLWKRSREVGALLFLSFICAPVEAQIDSAAYTQTTLDEVVAAHDFRTGVLGLPNDQTLLIKAEYKYRMRLLTTGRIRDLSAESQVVVAEWGALNPKLANLLREYTHEVEVVHEGKRFWLFWQRRLIQPFLAERREGGDIEIYAVLAGNVGRQLLLFVTAYESVL